jgi:transposase
VHARAMCLPGPRPRDLVIGYEESSQLDVEPAKYFVVVSKREKRACKSGEEQGVVSAPLPTRISREVHGFVTCPNRRANS